MTRPLLRQDLPLHKRLLAWFFDVGSAHTFGRSVPWIWQILRYYTVRDALQKLAFMQRSYAQLLAFFGQRDANILVGIGATLNGCRYCSAVHLLAGSLYHFRDTGQLFALDEAHVPSWQRLSDDEFLRELEQRLLSASPQETKLADLIRRQFALKRGAPVGAHPDDPYLVLSNALWNWLLDCTISIEEYADHPADPIGKDRALLAAYRRARAQVRVSSDASKALSS